MKDVRTFIILLFLFITKLACSQVQVQQQVLDYLVDSCSSIQRFLDGKIVHDKCNFVFSQEKLDFAVQFMEHNNLKLFFNSTLSSDELDSMALYYELFELDNEPSISLCFYNVSEVPNRIAYSISVSSIYRDFFMIEINGREEDSFKSIVFVFRMEKNGTIEIMQSTNFISII